MYIYIYIYIYVCIYLYIYLYMYLAIQKKYGTVEYNGKMKRDGQNSTQCECNNFKASGVWPI